VAKTCIYRVAVPSPLRRLFDYLPPKTASDRISPGCRVQVPFGKRLVVGLVVSQSDESALPAEKLRAIRSVIDTAPLIPDSLLDLILWAGNYYQQPPGDALMSALPVLLRQGVVPSTKTESHWQLSLHGRGLPENALPRAPKQQKLLGILRSNGIQTAHSLAAQGIKRDTLRALVKKGLVEAVPQPTGANGSSPHDRDLKESAVAHSILAESPLPLYPEQQQALNSLELHGFHTCLLQGETGSGKTEVYLQAIEKILRYGRQALVLVPEISLTPQTVNRFRQRFCGQVSLIHSGLTDRERLQAWYDARSGAAGVVIGTRSAVFTPLANPGIIIIDEEHDPSFKQQDGFRYSARDVAVMRASREQIPLILGSATPSLESLYNGLRGRYRIQRLSSRPGSARQPRWRLLDIRRAKLTTGLSAPLLEAIDQELKDGNQVLVFLNRRGFAPTLMCHDCGWIAECRHCATRMTVHRQRRAMLCHQCEQQQPLPDRCPQCSSQALVCLGQGTERCEDGLSALFPQFPVLRVDRDSTRRKQAMQQLIDRVDDGKACILVGTQILAKGHHFPNVTLVAILDTDNGLFSPDFRATERMGQLITQVAGRAGRGEKPGTVILQSHHCDHPLITRLTRDGYAAFARDLLDERQRAGLPPFRHMAIFRAESESAESARDMLGRLRQVAELEASPGPALTYLGPLPSPLEKRGGRYRFQLILLDENRHRLQQLLTRLCAVLDNDKPPRQVRWSVDVDSQDMV